MRYVLAVVLVAGCVRGAKMNELVAKSDHGRHPGFHAMVVSATAGENKPVVVTFGDKTVLTIPLCYAHAQSKIGDHDKFTIAIAGVQATAGELDIADCLSNHVTATVWATFPDGLRVDAKFDTALTQ